MAARLCTKTVGFATDLYGSLRARGAKRQRDSALGAVSAGARSG